jgi:hypothetical protein
MESEIPSECDRSFSGRATSVLIRSDDGGGDVRNVGFQLNINTGSPEMILMHLSALKASNLAHSHTIKLIITKLLSASSIRP